MFKLVIPMLAIATLAACEQQKAPPAAAQAPVDLATGERVYQQVCNACHGTGAGGAPRIGNQPQWETRLAQGNDTLYQHAKEGFTGSHGTMPPKGGKADLSDTEVKAGVDYMLSKLSSG